MVVLKSILEPAALLIVFFQNVMASVVYKCPDAGDEYIADSGSESIHLITIPADAMSNFEATSFRVEPLKLYECTMNYEVIKISLIGSADPNPKINFTTLPPTSDLGQNDSSEFVTTDGKNNGSAKNASFLYEPFFDSKSTSHFEGFMSSIENITAISDTGYNEDEEEWQCDRKLSRKEIHFTPSGFLFYFGEYYRATEYCIQSFNEGENTISIRKCRIDCGNERTPCISLCCHLHEHIDLKVPCCQATLESNPMFQPVIYGGINRRLSSTDSADFNDSTESNLKPAKPLITPHYVTFKYIESCPDGMPPFHLFFNENGDSSKNTKIHVQNTGRLAYLGENREWNFLDNFCVAGIVNAEHYLEDLSTMSSIVQYCTNDEVTSDSRWSVYVYIGSFGIATVFLAFTVIVYVLLWDKQNIHGWTILSFVVSEFFLFLFLSVSYSLAVFIDDEDDVATKSVYCVGSDLWWTFKSLTPLSERSKGRKRFCAYTAFAWGIPASVITTGLVLQHIYKRRDSGILVPDYGNRRCFLASHAEGVYLYYVIGALLLANLILITCTFYTIYQFKKSTRVASASSSKSKERSFKLFVKLVLVMGVTWSLEFILWFKGTDESFAWLKIAVDVFNILQAVATFVIFVCKRKIMNQLEQKHPSLRIITRPLLKLLASRPTALATSTDGKPTRSTTVGSSSVLQRSRKSMQRSSLADSKL